MKPSKSLSKESNLLQRFQGYTASLNKDISEQSSEIPSEKILFCKVSRSVCPQHLLRRRGIVKSSGNYIKEPSKIRRNRSNTERVGCSSTDRRKRGDWNKSKHSTFLLNLQLGASGCRIFGVIFMGSSHFKDAGICTCISTSLLQSRKVCGYHSLWAPKALCPLWGFQNLETLANRKD